MAVSLAGIEPRVGALVLINPYFGELQVKTRLPRLRRVGKRIPGIGPLARRLARPMTSEMDRRYQGSVDAGARAILATLLDRLPIRVIVGERDRVPAVIRELQMGLGAGTTGFSLSIIPGVSLNPINSLAAQQEARRTVVSWALRPRTAVDRSEPGWAVRS